MLIAVSKLLGRAVSFFFLMIRRPPRSTLFLYTTLFRSVTMDSGATTTMLPSLRSITTLPPPRVSMRSPGFRMYPAVSASGARPGDNRTAWPVTPAARATTGVHWAYEEKALRSARVNAAIGAGHPYGTPHFRSFTRYPCAFPRILPPSPVQPRLRGLPPRVTDNGRSAAGSSGGQDQGRRRRGGGSNPSLPG